MKGVRPEFKSGSILWSSASHSPVLQAAMTSTSIFQKFLEFPHSESSLQRWDQGKAFLFSSSLCNSFIFNHSPAWNLQESWLIRCYYYSYCCWNDSLLVLETGSSFTHHGIPWAEYGDLCRDGNAPCAASSFFAQGWTQLKINLAEHLPSQYRAPNSYYLPIEDGITYEIYLLFLS